MDGSWLRRAWWLHPVLLGAFPVLFLFAENVREHVAIDPLYVPLALAVAGAAAALLVTAATFRLFGADAARAGLVTSIGVAVFFGYGHLWQSVGEVVRMHRYLLAAVGVAALIGVALVLRAGIGRVRLATGLLNVVAIGLVVVNAVPVVGFALGTGAVSAAGSGPARDGEADQPDIWYLVFDRYGGEPALRRSYGVDNRPFLDALRERGFAVFPNATANYLKTAHSLVSTLEMDYLDADALLAEARAPDDWTPLYRTLQGSHAVERFLHDRGYEYLHLGVRRGATYTNATADRMYLYTDQTEFSAVLRETTLLAAFENLGTDEALGGIGELYRNHSLYQLNVLEQLASVNPDRPRFIFAHLLLPHPPYVFNADGTWVTPADAAARSPAEQYVEQLRHTNDRILRLLDAIGRSPGPAPIVVLQSDEGPFPERYARDEEGFDWTGATDGELVEKFSILSALRVPGVVPEDLGLPAAPTAVNAFRAVFNAAFDAGFEILPDRNLVFVDQLHLYDFRDVTDRLREALDLP